MSTREQAIAAALEAHNEKYIGESSHVYLLFGDGEIAWTKAGDLFGQRIMHLIRLAKFDSATHTFPYAFGKHTCVILNDEETALRIRDLM